MRTFYAFLTVVIIFGMIFMGFTNPSKDEYLIWVKINTIDQNSYLSKDVNSKKAIQYLEKSTTMNNYILFSTFKTDLGNEDVKVLGAFNNFFIY